MKGNIKPVIQFCWNNTISAPIKKSYILLSFAIIVVTCVSFKTEKEMLGKKMPDFELQDDKGNWVKSSDIPKPLVLFFYPKDDSQVCTREACYFRDHFQEFQSAGVTVYGISKDSISSHKNFLLKHKLPYGLLSDPGAKVAKLFSVKKYMGLFPARVTFIINKEGEIIHIFDSPLQAEAHVAEALTALGITTK